MISGLCFVILLFINCSCYRPRALVCMFKVLFSTVAVFIFHLSPAQNGRRTDPVLVGVEITRNIYTVKVAGRLNLYPKFTNLPGENNLPVQRGTANRPSQPLAPVNDDPCGAIILPINAVCNFKTYNNTDASATTGVPVPGCANYSGGDVWFRVRVPNNGTLTFDTQAGTITDAGMSIYTGPNCNSLTLISCDDNSSSNTNMPMIIATGLTPGNTIWIRIWGYGNNTGGTFGICASLPLTVPPCAGNNPAANTCATATAVCNFNGYCGNTSNRYTSDTWPELSNAFRDCIGGSATIENNSFISFVAAETSAAFNVWVTSSVSGNGIQMMFYNGGCGSGPVTCYGAYNNITGGPNMVSAGNLTVGNTYYLMLDGVGSDICDYTINPASGVDLLDINPDPAKICSGGSILLTAMGGNGVYGWSPAAGLSSTSGASVSASPATTTTYTVTTSGDGQCPAVITKQITVWVTPPPVTSSMVTICGSELPYSWQNVIITSAGTYADTLVNSLGCDSVSSLVLTVRPNTSSITNIGACPAQLPYNWNGNNYTTAGTYRASLINTAGCDSTATLNLTIGTYSQTSSNLSICPSSLPYSWNSRLFTMAGTYTDTLPGATCDSIITLVLNIKSNSASVSYDTICSSELPYLWNGNTYNGGGTYNVTLPNGAGCDSVATLVLTAIHTSSSRKIENICAEQLPYHWNETEYAAGGIYNITLTNAAGCDSTTTLILNVNSNTQGVFNQLVCPHNLPFTWNGNRYNTAGTYHVSLVNSAGCDSLATLNLSVATAPFVSLGRDTSLCPGDSIMLYPGSFNQYLWQDASTLPTFKVLQSGIYSVAVSSNTGCPGTATVAINYLPNCQDISFPNAITPNGDGNNDHFGAMGNLFTVSKYSLSIFNRNGELVFRSSNPYQRWDGIAKNKALGNAGFVWQAEYVLNGKTRKIQKGNLVVLR